MMMTEDWTKEWERRIINGVYPLRRYLGRSNHSVAFLTECKAQNIAQATIKILPANPALSEARLAHWRMLSTLSHPHLIRLLDAGRCQLGGHHFLFVVTEHAEQHLAQILPGRALTADEVRELLPATLDALAYLHGKNLVQGGLKPSNVLVVDDQLKLASDTIRAIGEPSVSSAKPSLYDPPEAGNGKISAAGDMWGLGITLVEALTQTPPAWSRERFDRVTLPANLAPEFVDTVRRCLNRIPGQRPAIAELIAQFKPAPAATSPPVTPYVSSSVAPPVSLSAGQPATPPVSPSAVTPASPAAAPPVSPSPAPPVIDEPSVRAVSTQNSPTTRRLVTAIAVGVITLGVVWAGVHLFHTDANVQQPVSNTARAPSAAPTYAASPPAASPSAAAPPVVAPPAAVEKPKAISAAPLPTVLHQEFPDVSRSARESIRGVIKITARVTVDRSGNVVTATLNNRGPSQYFARAAMDAAKKWKFSQAVDPASRVWLLHFGFARTGTTAHAALQ